MSCDSFYVVVQWTLLCAKKNMKSIEVDKQRANTKTQIIVLILSLCVVNKN